MVPGAAFILVAVALVVPVFFILMWVVGGYNRLVALRNRYQNLYGPIDLQLKHRYDLILELVELAKGYITRERGTLEAAVAARNAAAAASASAGRTPGDPAAMRELCGAEAELATTLERVFGLLDAYPDLKIDAGLMRLMQELTSTKTKLVSVQQAYNDQIMRYNAVREMFPTNMIAGPFGFGPAELFLSEKTPEQQTMRVSAA